MSSDRSSTPAIPPALRQQISRIEALALDEEARLAALEAMPLGGWGPLPEHLRSHYRRGLHLLRLGYRPVAIRQAIVAQATHEGLTESDGLEVALRVLNAPTLPERSPAMPLAEYLAREYPPVEPILGDGLLCRGDLAVMFGQPGVGKTRVGLALAIAVASGRPWLGLETHGPLPVEYHGLELSGRRLQTRLRAALGNLPLPEGLYVASREDERSAIDLLNPDTAAWIGESCAKRGLALFVVDVLGCALGNREESNEAFGELVEALNNLRYQHRTAFLLLHHPNKVDATGAYGSKARLAAMRGGTKLAASVNTAIEVDQVSGDYRRVSFVKANDAAKPEARCFLDGIGWPELVPSPAEASKQQGLENRSRVLEVIKAGLMDGLTATEVADQLSTAMKKRTVQNHLAALVSSGDLETRGKRYVYLESDAAQGVAQAIEAGCAQSDIGL